MPINARKLVLFIFAAAVVTSAAGSTPPADPAQARITAEVQRLQRLAAAQPTDDPEWNSLGPAVTRLLARASDGAQKGLLYAALDDLTKARSYAEAFAASRVSGEKAETPAFEAAWEEASLELTAADTRSHTRKWDGRPVLQQALAESAQGQTITLLEASRAYATVTDTRAGYYYIGEAKSDAETASFVYDVSLPAAGTRFRLRSWLPELQALQEKVNAAFVPPKSIDHHVEFIRLNSTIKLAKELDSARLYAGSLYQYLQAVQQFAAMDAPGVGEAKQAALHRDVVDWKTKLKASKRDDSLAQLFVERAELWMNHGDDSPVNDDQWKATSAVMGAVLPAYEAALAAVPEVRKETESLVTVTLVRWPYT